MDNLKVLIVEDEVIVAKNVETKLSKAGYKIVGCVTSGEQAIEKTMQLQPDVIIMDIKLNGQLDGIEAAKRIKQFLDIPVIYLTSYGDADTFQKAKSTDPFAYLIKPFNIDELSRVINLTLHNSSIKKELERVKTKYELAVSAGKTAVWEFFPDEQRTLSDDNLIKMFGYSDAAENVSADWIKFVHPEDLQTISTAIRNLINGVTENYSVQHRVIKQDGSVAWVLSNGKLLPADKKGLRKILGTVTDITEMKLIENELQRHAEELNKTNKAKDKFFSIVSHDLRNPFHTILGASELLAEQASEMNINEIKETSKNIYNAATNVYALLINLLEWSRFQTGHMKVVKSVFYISDVFEHVISLYTESINKKKISLNYNLIPSCKVYADRYMIESVIRNILSNAIKFTKPGGRIHINCKKSDENFIEISVKDNGIGISPENQKKLFKIDSQLSVKGTDMETGTGLGLVLCKDFIEYNDGKISFISELNKGSTFTFTIPIGTE